MKYCTVSTVECLLGDVSLIKWIFSLQFIARVYDRDTHEERDLPMNIIMNITDVNDNKPTFTDPLQFTVLEQTKAGEKLKSTHHVSD